MFICNLERDNDYIVKSDVLWICAGKKWSS